MNEKAENAPETKVVQSFDELPEDLRNAYKSQSDKVEGFYDPETHITRMIADNIKNSEWVDQVWAHENIVHGGLRSMLSPERLKRHLSENRHSARPISLYAP